MQALVAQVPNRSEKQRQSLNLLQDNVNFASVAASVTAQAEQVRALSETPCTLASPGSSDGKSLLYGPNLFSVRC